jgi:hypothetical protein
MRSGNQVTPLLGEQAFTWPVILTRRGWEEGVPATIFPIPSQGTLDDSGNTRKASFVPDRGLKRHFFTRFHAQA